MVAWLEVEPSPDLFSPDSTKAAQIEIIDRMITQLAAKRAEIQPKADHQLSIRGVLKFVGKGDHWHSHL
jgi:hypothetical protein